MELARAMYRELEKINRDFQLTLKISKTIENSTNNKTK
jgi:hypothetical protein